MMRACVQNVDKTVRYNTHSHSFQLQIYSCRSNDTTATPLDRTVTGISLNFVALQTRPDLRNF